MVHVPVGQTCVICMETFKPNEVLEVLLCQHLYHERYERERRERPWSSFEWRDRLRSWRKGSGNGIYYLKRTHNLWRFKNVVARGVLCSFLFLQAPVDVQVQRAGNRKKLRSIRLFQQVGVTLARKGRLPISYVLNCSSKFAGQPCNPKNRRTDAIVSGCQAVTGYVLPTREVLCRPE